LKSKFVQRISLKREFLMCRSGRTGLSCTITKLLKTANYHSHREMLHVITISLR